MKRKMITKTLFMSLIACISLPAYAADNNNQKRIICTPDEQNAAATLIQANIRGTLARLAQQDESMPQNKLAPQAELERRATQQAESDIATSSTQNPAATLIQAGARGALVRHEA